MTTALPMVTQCICRSITFASARAAAERSGSHTVEQLQQAIDIASGCGLCIPYLQRALESSADAIPLMNDDEADPYLARAGAVRTRDNGSGQ